MPVKNTNYAVIPTLLPQLVEAGAGEVSAHGVHGYAAGCQGAGLLQDLARLVRVQEVRLRVVLEEERHAEKYDEDHQAGKAVTAERHGAS